MLATLALEAGRAISHVDLADELWSDQPLGNVRNALQAQATRVRRVLDGKTGQGPAETVLRAVGNGYLLDIAPDRVDGTRFLELAARGTALLHDYPDRALSHLKQALELWRGPALLDAGDGLRCRSAAALFDERRLTVWEDIVSARLAVGDNRQAIADLSQLVAHHPLHERFYEQLMLALYRVGRHSDALDLFHRLRGRLDEQLGLEPSDRLKHRYCDILCQDSRLDEPTAIWAQRHAFRVAVQ
ncbi:AfsR/SARP family transcriptional regulator [Actinocrinis puniceicyclus]|uniref:AfsR/SARP family transcriptional regulator n=1 Tax=Actinocrinis puniceicyclus TaxID=977794 RepID=A0A8J8BDY1_9ACTN|nr:AfsR/SARP family transcriptional regulator [Actinocrinis puniceicyclus]MBS2964641.1 AfsR/SARP family transcriptional regulator [Actinocrinis puniceicyclus]